MDRPIPCVGIIGNGGNITANAKPFPPTCPSCRTHVHETNHRYAARVVALKSVPYRERDTSNKSFQNIQGKIAKRLGSLLGKDTKGTLSDLLGAHVHRISVCMRIQPRQIPKLHIVATIIQKVHCILRTGGAYYVISWKLCI